MSYTREDYDHAIKLLLNHFVNPIYKPSWYYDENLDIYRVHEDLVFGLALEGSIVRRTLPLAKKGVKSWT